MSLLAGVTLWMLDLGDHAPDLLENSNDEEIGREISPLLHDRGISSAAESGVDNPARRRKPAVTSAAQELSLRPQEQHGLDEEPPDFHRHRRPSFWQSLAGVRHMSRSFLALAVLHLASSNLYHLFQVGVFFSHALHLIPHLGNP